MAMDWQKKLPIHKLTAHSGERTRCKVEQKMLWVSAPFRFRFQDSTDSGEYQAKIWAEWGDKCGNGGNEFHLYTAVIMSATGTESDRFSWSQLPKTILSQAPADLLALKKFNGCYTFGPWYYIENTVFSAGDKDHNGLRKGEVKQTIGKNGPMWNVAAFTSSGEEISLHKLDRGLTCQQDCPDTELPTLAWVPVMTVGEGKERNLDAARGNAIWPEATDEDLIADGLATRLQDRLPAVLDELKGVVDGLGFTW